MGELGVILEEHRSVGAELPGGQHVGERVDVIRLGPRCGEEVENEERRSDGGEEPTIGGDDGAGELPDASGPGVVIVLSGFGHAASR